MVIAGELTALPSTVLFEGTDFPAHHIRMEANNRLGRRDHSL